MALIVTPPTRNVLLTVASLAMIVLAPAPPAAAQPAEAPAPPQAPDIARLWTDMIHGIRVAQPELASSNAQAILASEAPARQVYELYVATENVEQALTRGEGLEGMGELVPKIRQLVEAGFQEKRSNPEEIARAIQMLPESPRAYRLAASRLEQSGEYAMPQLIQKLADPQTSARMKEAIITVLPQLGRSAVRPLTMVLQSGDPQLLQVGATVLGQLQYPMAAPYLKQLLEQPGVLPRTQEAARAALLAVAGPQGEPAGIAQLFYDQALKYYYNEPSVAPDADSPTANVWYWRENLGLDFVPVPREIFDEVYAMRLARQALEHDPQMYPAVSLWLAARLRKAIQLPQGAVDPTTPADAPAAPFYALASSASFLQDVLQRALQDNDPELAKAAISALSQTAGAQSLVQAVEGGVQPLVAALGNADRGVRFLAALTLARALPSEPFEGQDQAVRVLNEMLRVTAGRRALLMVEDRQLANQLKDLLRAARYEVLDEPRVESGIAAANQTSGVDLVVLSAAPGPAASLARMRQESLLAATAVLVINPGSMAGGLATMEHVVVLDQPELEPQAVAAAIASAAQMGPEPMDEEEAMQWTVQSADVLWLLGMSGNAILDVSYSIGPLADVLADKRPEVQLGASRALSTMPSQTAQQALANLVLNEQESVEVRMLATDLLGNSVRRFGNLLTQEQSAAIVNLVVGDAQAPPELRTAAAAVMGALNLPSDQIKALILQAEPAP